MAKAFRRPDFLSGSVELRFEDDEVCIYATVDGLRKLVGLCQELIQKGKEEHLHLEDRNLLTRESARGAIALFSKND